MTPSNIDMALLATLTVAKAFSMLISWYTTKKTNAKLEIIHQATNGGVGVALEIAAVALERVAQVTKSALDVKAADLAREKYNEHMKAADK